MAFDKNIKSSRLLQSKRYTEATFDSQEAFTSVLDINANEIYTQQNAIPSSSIPYSGSSQNGSFVVSGSDNILQYFYRLPLTPGPASGSVYPVWFAISSSITASVSNQVIQANQLTSFISNKYAVPTLGPYDAESASPNTAYNVVLTTGATAATATVISVNDYAFDYKQGVLEFTQNDPSTSSKLYLTAYKYVGQTLTQVVTSIVNLFPYTGSADITGSLNVVGPIVITGSSSTSPFLINIPDGNGDEDKLKVNEEGALVLGKLNTAPTAVSGALFYSSSNEFFFGFG
jgi:hypothetical protein